MPVAPVRIAALLLLVAAGPVASTELILQCDFDDLSLDQPIGTGGPAVGEPVEVSAGVTTLVRQGPFPTPCLVIFDNTASTGSVRFGFEDGAEITSGSLSMSVSLRFHQRENFLLYVREAVGSTTSHVNLSFYDDGSIWHSDLGTATHSLPVSYVAGQTLDFRILFEFTSVGSAPPYTGTYTVILDNEVVVSDSAFEAQRGVGSVLFGVLPDPDTEGEVALDDLLVLWDSPATAVGASAFSSWGRIKSAWR